MLVKGSECRGRRLLWIEIDTIMSWRNESGCAGVGAGTDAGVSACLVLATNLLLSCDDVVWYGVV